MNNFVNKRHVASERNIPHQQKPQVKEHKASRIKAFLGVTDKKSLDMERNIGVLYNKIQSPEIVAPLSPPVLNI